MMLTRLQKYNKIKAVVNNCASLERTVNLKILNGLLNEIHVNVQLALQGYGNAHVKRSLAQCSNE